MQNATSSGAALIGRILLSAIFLMSGTQKLLQWNQTMDHMRSEGMTAVPLLLVGAVIFELAGGLMLLLGWRARLGALLLVVFLIPTTLIFHDFWTYQEAAAMQNQMQHFMKNITIMGGLLMVAAFGPGRVAAHVRSANRTDGD